MATKKSKSPLDKEYVIIGDNIYPADAIEKNKKSLKYNGDKFTWFFINAEYETDFEKDIFRQGDIYIFIDKKGVIKNPYRWRISNPFYEIVNNISDELDLLSDEKDIQYFIQNHCDNYSKSKQIDVFSDKRFIFIKKADFISFVAEKAFEKMWKDYYDASYYDRTEDDWKELYADILANGDISLDMVTKYLDTNMMNGLVEKIAKNFKHIDTKKITKYKLVPVE